MRRSERQPFVWLFIITLLFSMTSCKKTSPSPLQLGLNVWAGFTPFYAAADRGLFSPVQVEITTFSAFYDVHRAFERRQIDVAAAPLLDALQMVDNGIDLQIILVTGYSSGTDGLIARKSIATLKDLRGKRIAAELGTLPHLLLLRALERGGIMASEVVFVNLPADKAAEELKQGGVDAAELWEPYLSRLRGEDTHLLFTTAETPAEFPDVLITTKDAVEQRRKDLIGVLRAWDKALALWKTKPEEIVGIMARTMEMTPEELKAAEKGITLTNLAANRALLDRESQGTSLFQAYDFTMKFMVLHQLLKHPPRPAQEIIDTRLVAEAAAE